MLWNATAGVPAPTAAVLPWLSDAYGACAERLRATDPGYPCHFGVQGQQAGGNWFTALQSDAVESDAAESTAVDRGGSAFGLDRLADTVRAYRRQAWTGPKRQTLLILVGPPDPAADLARDRERFWALLAGLSARDERPWPADQPTDTADPRWQWCFDGEPWFVFAASPGHHRRRSRDLGPCLVAVFQVRRVFDGLSGSSPAGRAAKTRVRQALDAYDRIGVHPHLGDPDASSTHKWRQYVLPDDDHVAAPGACPFTAPAPAPAPAPKGATP